MTAVRVTTPATAAAAGLVHLQRLASALGDAVTPDDVARSALAAAVEMTGVVRAGLAVSRAAGRELDFVATDDDAVSGARVRWCQIDGLADVPLAHAVRNASPVLVGSLDELQARFGHMVERQRGLGTRAMAAFPLVTGERAIGGLLVSFGDDQPFDAHAVAFWDAFAAQVTQALRRGLVYQREQTTSELLQRSLLPQSLPELEQLALGAFYRPGGKNVDVGGDWYDVLPLPDGSVAVVLGDVMGRGVSAAIVMGEIRAAVRAYALLDPRPELVLTRLDALVSSLGAPEQIVTLVYAVVRRDGCGADLAVAGHPPPLLVAPAGAPQLVPAAVGPPIGLGAGPWPVTHVGIPHGGTLLLYSDGLVESRTLELDSGLDRLCCRVAAMEVGRRNPRELCATLGELPASGPDDDDVTMLAVGPATPHRRTATEQLPSDTSAAMLARRFLGRQLAQWGLGEDVVRTAQLCVSELVTNAVIHTGTSPRVTAQYDDERLLVLVQDQGNRGTARPVSDHDVMDVSGRGLSLVGALVSAWGAEHGADGTTVWFELGLAVGPAESPGAASSTGRAETRTGRT